MTLLILYVTTFVVFLGLDFLGLTYLIRPVFERDIGHMLIDSFRIFPAFLFYAFYVGMLLWFVTAPAVRNDFSLWWVFGSAAMFGAVGYGTYEFSNYATLRDWTAQMVLTDLLWGMGLTATSATIGVAITRPFA